MSFTIGVDSFALMNNNRTAASILRSMIRVGQVDCWYEVSSYENDPTDNTDDRANAAIDKGFIFANDFGLFELTLKGEEYLDAHPA